MTRIINLIHNELLKSKEYQKRVIFSICLSLASQKWHKTWFRRIIRCSIGFFAGAERGVSFACAYLNVPLTEVLSADGNDVQVISIRFFPVAISDARASIHLWLETFRNRDRYKKQEKLHENAQDKFVR